MKLLLHWILALPLCLLMASSQAQPDNTTVDQIARTFATQYNSADFAAIYQASAQGMKTAITQADFEKTMRSVHSVLGNIVRYDWRSIGPANAQDGANLVIVKYQTQFEKGVGEQVFFLQRQSPDYLIYQWNINSDDLIKGMVNKLNP